MSDDIEIVEVTAIELAIVGDRLHATLASGSRKRTYSISFHKARGAIQAGTLLLDEHTSKPSNVRRLGARRAKHG